jgi:uncharacterized protein YbjT (DUF2867 family)
MQHKKIAVLGGTGFVGSSIVTKLDAAGYQVKVLTRRREDGKHLILLPNVQVVECHLPNTHALKDALRDCDAVINSVGILFESRKNTFEAIHHQLPRRLVQMCEELGISRIVHLSALKANKNAPSQYLKSKAMGESALNEFSKKLDITIFKPSVIFGRDDAFINMFANLVRLFPIIPLAKPAAKFQPIWVEDVASCVVNALENTTTYGRIYELGGPTVYTLKDLVLKVAAILGKQPTIIGLSHRFSLLQALAMEWMPIKLMSRDNVRSMQVDSVCDQQALDLMQTVLGVTPVALEVIAPAYLLNATPRNAYSQFRTAAGRAISGRR